MGGHKNAMPSEVRTGRREGVERCRGKWRAEWGRLKRLEGQGTRGAHLKHPPHVRDHGRIEAQRLVEHRRPLASQREGGHIKMRSEVRAGRREGVERCGGAGGMHGGRPRLGEGPRDSGLVGARERT